MRPSKLAHEQVILAIDLLRKKIHEQGFTEPEVAEALNWRKSSFEDLNSEPRRFYVEDLFSVLEAIGVEARAFFTELYGPPPRSGGPLPKSGDPPAELASLSTVVDRIAELLIKKGHITAGELARATVAQAGRGPRRKTTARQVTAAGAPEARGEPTTPATASRDSEARP